MTRPELWAQFYAATIAGCVRLPGFTFAAAKVADDMMERFVSRFPTAFEPQCEHEMYAVMGHGATMKCIKCGIIVVPCGPGGTDGASG